MCRGHTLSLHDVLYAPNIRRNLVSLLALLGLGFSLNFHDLVMELYLGTTFYGFGFILDGFMILDVDIHELSNDSCYSLMATTRNTCDGMILWKARLGYIGQKRMNGLAKSSRSIHQNKYDNL